MSEPRGMQIFVLDKIQKGDTYIELNQFIYMTAGTVEFFVAISNPLFHFHIRDEGYTLEGAQRCMAMIRSGEWKNAEGAKEGYTIY